MTLPRHSCLFENVQRDADSRGEILSIVDAPVQNVSLITCTPGSIRSNHFHHSDFHFMYVLEGEIDYFYKDIETGEIKYLKVREGDNIFTPDNELHGTYFPVKTRLIVSSCDRSPHSAVKRIRKLAPNARQPRRRPVARCANTRRVAPASCPCWSTGWW